MLTIQPEEFRVFSKYIWEICGISLDESKAYLIETRLKSLAEDAQCSTFSEYYYMARNDKSKKIENEIIDAITTGETSFFRDKAPFELMEYKIIPEIIDRNSKKVLEGNAVPIRIWSAACSSGQEIYSIAILLRELLGSLAKYQIRLVGSDISRAAIEHAELGVYNSFEVGRGLSAELQEKYFIKDNRSWRLVDDIRNMVSFRTSNLLLEANSYEQFDLILCRNVAIYFDQETKKKMFTRLKKSLVPNGYLIIGATETISSICPEFKPSRHLGSVFYQLK